jgi:hypothetical protein
VRVSPRSKNLLLETNITFNSKSFSLISLKTCSFLTDFFRHGKDVAVRKGGGDAAGRLARGGAARGVAGYTNVMLSKSLSGRIRRAEKLQKTSCKRQDDKDPNRLLMAARGGLTPGRIFSVSRSLRRGSLALVALAPVILAGCGAGKPVTAAPNDPAPPHRPAFSLDTPLNHIAADKRGKAVLERDLPGLMASRSYALFDDMSLSQIAVVSGGRLTKAKLDTVQADLAQLSSRAGDGP